jgi:hypothetical protein
LTAGAVGLWAISLISFPTFCCCGATLPLEAAVSLAAGGINFRGYIR